MLTEAPFPNRSRLDRSERHLAAVREKYRRAVTTCRGEVTRQLVCQPVCQKVRSCSEDGFSRSVDIAGTIRRVANRGQTREREREREANLSSCERFEIFEFYKIKML